MDYWPDVVISKDLRAPIEILQEAAEELETKQSLLSVNIERHELEDRVSLAFMVTNKVARAKVNLFEALQGFENDYPVALRPNIPSLPNFLKKKRVVRSGPILGIPEYFQEKTEVLENKWVCSTPEELREKLRELLFDDATQVVLLNLLRMSNSTEESAANDSTLENEERDDE